MLFGGIDLGWSANPSGIAVLEWNGKSLQTRRLARVASHADVVAEIRSGFGDQPAWIGIDAPVIVKNPKGMRAADKQAHSLFSNEHAGCYPVNLAMPFAAGILGLVEELRIAAFSTDLPRRFRSASRQVFEVFPHSAAVRLFALPRILAYKKGKVAARHDALLAYRSLLATGLRHRKPAFACDGLPEPGTSLKELKACEDKLDAVLCAYIAAHFWYWGLARNNVLGDAESGWIANPSF